MQSIVFIIMMEMYVISYILSIVSWLSQSLWLSWWSCMSQHLTRLTWSNASFLFEETSETNLHLPLLWWQRSSHHPDINSIITQQRWCDWVDEHLLPCCHYRSICLYPKFHHARLTVSKIYAADWWLFHYQVYLWYVFNFILLYAWFNVTCE